MPDPLDLSGSYNPSFDSADNLTPPAGNSTSLIRGVPVVRVKGHGRQIRTFIRGDAAPQFSKNFPNTDAGRQSYLDRYVNVDNPNNAPHSVLNKMLETKPEQWAGLLKGFSGVGQQALIEEATRRNAQRVENSAAIDRSAKNVEAFFASGGADNPNLAKGNLPYPKEPARNGPQDSQEYFDSIPNAIRRGVPIGEGRPSHIGTADFAAHMNDVKQARRNFGNVIEGSVADMFATPSGLAQTAAFAAGGGAIEAGGSALLGKAAPWIINAAFAGQLGPQAIEDAKNGNYSALAADFAIMGAPHVAHGLLRGVKVGEKPSPIAAESPVVNRQQLAQARLEAAQSPSNRIMVTDPHGNTLATTQDAFESAKQFQPYLDSNTVKGPFVEQPVIDSPVIDNGVTTPSGDYGNIIQSALQSTEGNATTEPQGTITRGKRVRPTGPSPYKFNDTYESPVPPIRTTGRSVKIGPVNNVDFPVKPKAKATPKPAAPSGYHSIDSEGMPTPEAMQAQQEAVAPNGATEPAPPVVDDTPEVNAFLEPDTSTPSDSGYHSIDSEGMPTPAAMQLHQPNVAPAEPPAAVPEPVDDVEPVAAPKPVTIDAPDGAQLHGTSSPIKGDSVGSLFDRSQHQNLYGPGLYTTDSHEAVLGYSKKGRGTEPTVYHVKWSGENPPRLLNLDNEIPADAVDVFNGAAGVDTAGMTGKEAYSLFKERMREEGMTSQDAQDYMLDVSHDLQKAGYDGFQHIGGNIKNKVPPHNVEIYFKHDDGGTPPLELNKVGINPDTPLKSTTQPVAQSNTPEPAAPHGATEPKVVSTFTTSKGSTYQVHEDGTTTRNKSYHPEHGKADQGIKARSDMTVYAPPDVVDNLSVFHTTGRGSKSLAYDKGHLAVRYDSGPDTGKIIQGTIVPVNHTPQVGYLPIEIWNGGKKAHFGNVITEHTPAEQAATPEPIAPHGATEPETPPVDETPQSKPVTKTSTNNAIQKGQPVLVASANGAERHATVTKGSKTEVTVQHADGTTTTHSAGDVTPIGATAIGKVDPDSEAGYAMYERLRNAKRDTNKPLPKEAATFLTDHSDKFDDRYMAANPEVPDLPAPDISEPEVAPIEGRTAVSQDDIDAQIKKELAAQLFPVRKKTATSDPDAPIQFAKVSSNVLAEGRDLYTSGKSPEDMTPAERDNVLTYIKSRIGKGGAEEEHKFTVTKTDAEILAKSLKITNDLDAIERLNPQDRAAYKKSDVYKKMLANQAIYDNGLKIRSERAFSEAHAAFTEAIRQLGGQLSAHTPASLLAYMAKPIALMAKAVALGIAHGGITGIAHVRNIMGNAFGKNSLHFVNDVWAKAHNLLPKRTPQDSLANYDFLPDNASLSEQMTRDNLNRKNGFVLFGDISKENQIAVNEQRVKNGFKPLSGHDPVPPELTASTPKVSYSATPVAPNGANPARNEGMFADLAHAIESEKNGRYGHTESYSPELAEAMQKLVSTNSQVQFSGRRWESIIRGHGEDALTDKEMIDHARLGNSIRSYDIDTQGPEAAAKNNIPKLDPQEEMNLLANPKMQNAIHRYNKQVYPEITAMRKAISPKMVDRSAGKPMFTSLVVDRTNPTTGGSIDVDNGHGMVPGLSSTISDVAQLKQKGSSKARQATGSGDAYSTDWLTNLIESTGRDRLNYNKQQVYNTLLSAKDSAGNQLAIVRKPGEPPPTEMTYNGKQYRPQAFDFEMVDDVNGDKKVVKIYAPPEVVADLHDAVNPVDKPKNLINALRSSVGGAMIQGQLLTPNEPYNLTMRHAAHVSGQMGDSVSKVENLIRRAVPPVPIPVPTGIGGSLGLKHINTPSGASLIGLIKLRNVMNHPEAMAALQRLADANAASNRPFRQMHDSFLNGVPVVGKGIAKNAEIMHQFLFGMPGEWRGEASGKSLMKSALQATGLQGFHIRATIASEIMRHDLQGHDNPKAIRENAYQLGQFVDKPDHIVELARDYMSPFSASTIPGRVAEVKQVLGMNGIKLPDSAPLGAKVGKAADTTWVKAGLPLTGMAIASYLYYGKFPWQNPKGHKTEVNMGNGDYSGIGQVAPTLGRPLRDTGALAIANAALDGKSFDEGAAGVGSALANTGLTTVSNPILDFGARAIGGLEPYTVVRGKRVGFMNTPRADPGKSQKVADVSAALLGMNGIVKRGAEIAKKHGVPVPGVRAEK